MGDKCNANVGCIQASLSRYYDSCTYVGKCFSDDGVRLEARRAAASIKAGEEMCSFLRGLVLSLKDLKGKNIAHAQVSASKHSSMLVETICVV